jgi:autotransporter-associated beta strand protein
VTVTGGGLIFSANNKTHTANFSFGNAEGFLWADAGQQTLSGTLTGTNGLTKGGASTVLLSANNTATLKGPVTVNQGALQLNHATALGQTNDLFVGYGATLNVNEQTNLQVGNLGGHGTIMLNGRAITVYGRLNPGSIGSVGRLTISQTGTVAFASGAAMTFDLGALARLSDSLLVSQAHVSLNGALVSINNVDGMAAGAYTLIATSGGSMTGSPGALLLPPGFGGVLSVINNNLVLTISGATQGTMVTVR